jgi:phage replication-related protein YjqB (UPF0714/DUF867 family)
MRQRFYTTGRVHTYLRDGNSRNNVIAIFYGVREVRESNARLFLRAQHIDELVEVATEAHGLVSSLHGEAVADKWHTLMIDRLEVLEARLSTILAKIKEP